MAYAKTRQRDNYRSGVAPADRTLAGPIDTRIKTEFTSQAALQATRLSRET